MSTPAWRKRKRREILPGFPWGGQFQTKRQIVAYFAGDRIQCLRCGKWYRRLGLHVAVHGWNEQEYRKRYGLPWRRGLTSEDSHNRYAAALERRLACGEEGWGATPETQALASKAPRRAQQPYHRLLSLENLTGATAAAQGRAFSKTCPACGRQFEAKGPGRRRCPTCGPWKSQIRPPRIWCCVACGKEFTGNTGHSPRCPECRVIVRRQKSAVRGREWGRAHPERRTAIHKKWAQAHRVHLNEYNRKRRANRESP